MLTLTCSMPDGSIFIANGTTSREAFTKVIKKAGCKTLRELNALKLKGEGSMQSEDYFELTKSDFLQLDEIVS
jgi:hypothetical protein